MTPEKKGTGNEDGIGEKINTERNIENLPQGVANFVLSVKQSISLLIEPIKEGFEEFHKSFVDFLANKDITPNLVGLARVILLLGSIIEVSLGEKEFAIVFYMISCYGDAVDGKLAREHNMISTEGGICDPIIDKMTEISGSVIIIIMLCQNGNYTLAGLQGILTSLRAIQHYKSQFRENRPPKKEQFEMFYKAILSLQKVEYIKEAGTPAANKYGKQKTILQMVSIISLLINNSIIGPNEIQTILNYILVGLGGYSLYPGHKSINPDGNLMKDIKFL